jgi:hypothetical protein
MSRHDQRRNQSIVRATLLSAALGVCFYGCANVKPYQREFLADPIMQITIDPEEDSYDMHMHRALTQGLYGAAGGGEGGGCGCEQ